jgi:hypothetical protein
VAAADADLRRRTRRRDDRLRRGDERLRGRPISFLHALQVVVETFTTTGFGSDAPWETPEMNVLIIVMDLTGVALIFLALPVLVFPLFEEAISTTVPTEAPGPGVRSSPSNATEKWPPTSVPTSGSTRATNSSSPGPTRGRTGSPRRWLRA